MELKIALGAMIWLKDMYFHLGSVTLYGMLVVWNMSQMTVAQLRPSSIYQTRSSLDWPPVQNEDNFFIPISERFTSVKHAQDSGLLQSLKRVRERMIAEKSEILPWSCNCKYGWRDLGSGYNPRFVREGSCRSKTCWFGHFACRTI
ncbi:uncharacterized protein LOC132727518 [Ruditapes philippinarum]|uniref:uncharacterized protein LOC132727518 n=1 Tax=Ruditapes philippinarum TaxID=129788 RepID=UPI00295B6DE2|nr:uncharacterized protein LOC132727518 [Ruditapes philippinarum]